MRVIIAGSRGWNDADAIAAAMAEHFPDCTEVVCGMCHGADMLGKKWADRLAIRVAQFPAKWEAFGPYAGPRRNQQMANYASPSGGLLACRLSGISRGTDDMIRKGRAAGLKVVVIEPAAPADPAN